MSTEGSAASSEVLSDAKNFSLILGGPLYQLLRRTRLADDALQMVVRRIVVISLLAWLPLLVISALEGHLVGKSVAVPFLADIESHIRFLVVVPLFLAAELMVHQRLLPVARAFLDRRLIPEAAMGRFDRAIRSAFALRNSLLAELLLLAFVYAVGVMIVWRGRTVLDAATWYVSSSSQGSKLSLAGWWYACVSLPIFQFLLLRWYFRLFIWMRFLWQVSRIQLVLVPTHPDQVGGLGFLGNTVYAFTVLLVAHGAMVAARLAYRIFFLGDKLPHFSVEIVGMAIFVLLVVFGPLFVFSTELSRTKRRGLLEYGAFAERYVRGFDVKWLRGGAAGDEQLLGTADLQSLADLSNSFAVVRSMRVAPVSRDAIVQLAAALLIPLLPLLLTMMPLEELLKKLLGMLF